MNAIKVNTPVSIMDRNGTCWWGVALTGVLTDDQPWPLVVVQLDGHKKPVKVPARDVAVARVTYTSASVDWAA